MERTSLKTLLRHALTCVTVMVTVLLWGYLIGTFLAQRDGFRQAAISALEITPQLEHLQGSHALQDDVNDSQPQSEASLYEPEYRRFLQRDSGFTARLHVDRAFLLENSF